MEGARKAKEEHWRDKALNSERDGKSGEKGGREGGREGGRKKERKKESVEIAS